MDEQSVKTAPPVELVDVARTPLADLRGMHPVLAAIMRRAFKPGDREKLTVSAFGSAL